MDSQQKSWRDKTSGIIWSNFLLTRRRRYIAGQIDSAEGQGTGLLRSFLLITPLFLSCETLDELFNLSGLQFPLSARKTW